MVHCYFCRDKIRGGEGSRKCGRCNYTYHNRYAGDHYHEHFRHIHGNRLPTRSLFFACLPGRKRASTSDLEATVEADGFAKEAFENKRGMELGSLELKSQTALHVQESSSEAGTLPAKPKRGEETCGHV